MVRVINIDTKARTIRVSNGKDDLEWFTTDTGSHVPLKKDQSKAEAIKEHFGDKKAKQQPAKKVKETYADTSEIDGAEVFKDGDDYVVLYANGTKTREFSSKTEADKFAKSLSKQPAKKSAAEIFKDAGDDTGWKSIKSGSHHQFFDENNWAQREHEYVYLPDGDDSFDNYARIEKDTDGDPRVVVTLVKDGERVYKDPFDGYDDQAGNMQAAIEAVARAFGK